MGLFSAALQLLRYEHGTASGDIPNAVRKETSRWRSSTYDARRTVFAIFAVMKDVKAEHATSMNLASG